MVTQTQIHMKARLHILRVVEEPLAPENSLVAENILAPEEPLLVVPLALENLLVAENTLAPEEPEEPLLVATLSLLSRLVDLLAHSQVLYLSATVLP